MHSHEVETSRRTWPNGSASYSAAVAAGGLVHTCGLVARDPETGAVRGDTVPAQLDEVFARLEAVLRQAGASMAGVVDMMIFLTDHGHWRAANERFAVAFPTDPPTRTIVAAGLAEGVLVEIRAVALLDDPESVN